MLVCIRAGNHRSYRSLNIIGQCPETCVCSSLDMSASRATVFRTFMNNTSGRRLESRSLNYLHSVKQMRKEYFSTNMFQNFKTGDCTHHVVISEMDQQQHAVKHKKKNKE
ncbi:hypothetical protein T07_9627 [Trichinella nelsoni]|uniref:Uncharacterized protein n=1 Tax=Trichinella nelsoni TaxID=6336 RepID=A0A0V0S060_9BILA|nr:hypothetical protein T07_9627 [Trichinella nelsoni]